MFRKLSVALAVSLALLPTESFPLGLGEILSKSVLNDSFKADIPLTAVAPGEIDDIKVQLASPTDFARAGVERPYLLTKLRFQPVVQENGKPVIRVTTREPVREPFLDFLVEVNWPKGRLVRQFTVLLDPPVTLDRAPPAIAAPILTPPAPIARGEPAPAAPPPPLDLSGAGQYTVPRGATLLGIARGLNIPGVSSEQVATALFRANPDAFIGNNINRLRAGRVLRIPDAEQIGLLAGNVPGRGGARARPAAEADQLRLATPAPQESAPAKPVAPAGDLDRVKTDLMLVRESSESTRQETDELRTRIRDLESQLTDIRNLLKLKSDQLAQLQTAQATPPATVAPTGAPESRPALTEPPAQISEPPASPTTPGVQATPEPTPADRVAPTTPPEAAALEPPAEGTQPLETTPVVPTPETPLATAEPPPVTQPPAVATPPKPAPAKPTPPEPDLIDQILGDTTLLGVVGGGAVVLLSLIWLLLRRRREAGVAEEMPLLAPTSLAKAEGTDGRSVVGTGDAKGVASTPPEKGEPTEESSFLSGFSSSDMETLQDETGEVDPAAEADVYIAYGRYQQAENLINQALKKDPERLELRLKLLEIHFTTRNGAGFAKLAEDMEQAGVPRRDPPTWQRVVSMGRDLLPGHPLFGGTAPPSGLPGTLAMGGGLGLGAGLAALADNKPTSPTLEDMDLGQPGEDQELLRGLDLDLDRDLDELTLNLGQETAPSELPTSPVSTGKWDAGTPTTPSWGQPPASSPTVEEPELSLDLDNLGALEDVDVSGLEPTLEPDLTIPATGTFQQVSSRLNLEPEEEPAPLSLDDLDLGDLGGGFETTEQMPEFGEDVETKIDLARAYLDMGDGEGARDLLQEVLREGDAQQQAVARDLLQQIA